MKPKRAIKLLIGVALLALYELFLDDSGVGIKGRWSMLKGWSDK